MSTVEKLFVQIFDKKRSIIDHLKQHKLLFDQHLASKLIIQGITPPPWLLNTEFPSGTSDLTAINKEELISGLLLPQPGPSIACPSGTRFLYENSVATGVNDGTCAKTCGSSNGSEGVEPGVIPSDGINQTDDVADVVPQCHVDGTENYVPMSPDDQTDTKNSNTYSKLEESLARIHRSRSRQKALELRNSGKASGLGKGNNVGSASGNKAFGNDRPSEGVRKSVEQIGPSALSTCINEEAAVGDCLNMEMRSDACSDSSSQSRRDEANLAKNEDDDGKKETQVSVCDGINNRSSSCRPQSISGGHQNSRKSHEVCIGPMTRSGSGKAQVSENKGSQNKRVTISSSNRNQPTDGNHSFGAVKVSTGRIAKSRSGRTKEAKTKDHSSKAADEIEDHRSRAKNKMSVRPKQLDFDEFEETSVADSLGEGKGNLEDKTGDHSLEETHVSLPSSSSAGGTSTKCTSSLHETLGVPEIDVDNLLPEADMLSGQNSLLLDCPPCSTDEHMLGITMEHVAEPGLSEQNVDISLSQKRTIKPVGEQELDNETCNLSDADTEHAMNLHKDIFEATRSPEEARPDLSSCNDCAETSYCQLHDASTEAATSLHQDAVEPTISLKKAGHVLDSCSDCKDGGSFSLPNADTEATASLPRVVEATLSSEKTRHASSSRNDCKEANSLTLPTADAEATASLHRDGVTATLSSEKTKHELSSYDNCKEASHFGVPNVDYEVIMNLNRDDVEATSSQEQSRHEPTSCNEFNSVSETPTRELVPHSPDRKLVGSFVSVIEFPAVKTLEEAGYENSSEILKSGSLFRNSDIQTSCFSSHVEIVECAKLLVVQAGIDVLPACNVSSAMNGSWPRCKRRKIGHQTHYRSASPSVRVNTFPGIINESIPNRSMDDGKENSSCPPQKLIISEDVDAILLNSEFVAEAADGLTYLGNEGPEPAPEVQYEEGEGGLRTSVVKPFTPEQKSLSASRNSNVKQDTTTELSDCFPAEEGTEAPLSTVHSVARLSNGLEFAEVVGQGNSTYRLTFANTILDERESVRDADKLKFSIASPLFERMDVDGGNPDEIVPEYEGFFIAENRESVHNAEGEFLNGEIPFVNEATECANSQIPRSLSFSTPASPFPTGYKLNFTPSVYRSVPNGLIENIDLTSNLQARDNALLGKSYSDYCSFPGKQLGRDITTPFVSPVGGVFESIMSKSGSSGKRLSSNPELICFPIQEDPETSEEDEHVNDTFDTEMNRLAPNVRSSSIREPLRDITAMNASIPASSHEVVRDSVESVTTEVSISEKHKEDNKNEMHLRSRQTGQGKENHSLSIGANSMKKQSESLSSRYSKPKLSGKSSLRSRGQSLSEKESKRNNIVSNVKSFLPLVQQKQAASVVPAKRDVKVKALEAAEAAKRLAEKRENERKQKKEALKLERARLEQENLKQIELKKKLKEEEKKKKDAENAARKRQREEEDRKEKEKKRKRIEEARCQQKQAEEKISAWREESRCETKDGRTNERKNPNDKADKAAEKENVSRNPVELVASDGIKSVNAMTSTHDNKSSTGSSDTGKAGNTEMADVSTPNCDKSDKQISMICREQSYDISPYQCSDDEEEEEDEIPNRKFIPSWASKSNVAAALTSLKHLDPDTIFPPGSFCCLEEVLLPRRLAQK